MKSPAAMPPMRDIVFSIVAYEMKVYPHTSGSLMCSSLLGTMIEERSSRRNTALPSNYRELPMSDYLDALVPTSGLLNKAVNQKLLE